MASPGISHRDPVSHGLVIGADLDPDLPGAFNEALQEIALRANVRVGTDDQRNNLQPSEKWLNLEWLSTTDGRAYTYNGSGWQRKHRRQSVSGGGGSTTLVPAESPPLGGGAVDKLVMGSFSLSGSAAIVDLYASVHLWLPVESVYGGAVYVYLDGALVDDRRWHSHGHGGRIIPEIWTDVDVSEGSHTIQVAVGLDRGSASGIEVHDPHVHFKVSAG